MKSDDEIVLAADDGDFAKVERLIRSGADVNTRGEAGMTALHWAVAHGDPRAVEILVDAGAE